eukprot:7723841-Heterocapsa_arctica.AAC.1
MLSRTVTRVLRHGHHHIAKGDRSAADAWVLVEDLVGLRDFENLGITATVLSMFSQERTSRNYARLQVINCRGYIRAVWGHTMTYINEHRIFKVINSRDTYRAAFAQFPNLTRV